MEHLDWTMGVILPYVNFVTFLVVAFVLFKKPATLAAKKALDAFDKFSQEAKVEKAQAEQALKEILKRFSSLDEEIEAMKRTAEQSALAEEKALIAEGQRLAEHIRFESKRTMDAEIEKVRMAISEEILDIVKKEVARKIKEDVSESAHHQLIVSQIGHLKSVRSKS